MEIRNFEDLQKDPRNPRRISQHDFNSLVASIRRFGDLSGIVRNVTSGQLVGGHQRLEAFKKLSGEKRIIITNTFEQPDRQGTIAIGHIEIDGTFFTYREVQWDEATQKAANIAANRIQGEFDLDLLAEINYELMQEDAELLKLTGQTEEEVADLMKASGALDDDRQPTDPSMILKIEFDNDQQMAQLHKELTERGFKVKI